MFKKKQSNSSEKKAEKNTKFYGVQNSTVPKMKHFQTIIIFTYFEWNIEEQ